MASTDGPYVKIPEVGLFASGRRVLYYQWGGRIDLGHRNPLSIAVNALLSRLFEQENLVLWESEEILNEDIDLAIKLLEDLRNGSSKTAS